MAFELENYHLPNNQPSDNPVYEALDQGEIRILELNPGQIDDTLQGSLHVARVDFQYPTVNHLMRHTNHAISVAEGDVLWYTALSYTWGAPIFDVDFHFANDVSIKITNSLALALRHLRDKDESVFLWIDQICIDQTNDREKERQIPLMGLIYTHATNTVIWLGDEGEDDPKLAFDILQLVHGRLQLLEGSVQIDDFERLGFPSLNSPIALEWIEVQKLFCRSWFTRLWVIQEAVLSLSLYMKCGQIVVGWDDFTLWCDTMKTTGVGELLERVEVSPGISSGLETVHELSSIRQFNQAHKSRTGLLDSLVMSRYAQASNAKDKIYGVLGISASEIHPRYSENVSVREVYREAAITILPTDLFRLLSCVDNDTPQSPSWVPDWTSEALAESLGSSTKAWALYFAGGGMFEPDNNNTDRFTYALENDGECLVLTGMIVDTVESLGNVIQSPFVEIKDNKIHTSNDWIALIAMLESISSYPTADTVWDAFWQTLVAGRDSSFHSKAPQEYSEVLSLVVDEICGRELHIPGQPYSPRRKKGFFTVKSLTSRKPKQTFDDLNKALNSAVRWRKFAITQKGYFCLVPKRTEPGDTIAVHKNGPVPYVVRKKLDGNARETFELIGETYVHGIMHGEALSMEDAKFTSIRLV